MQLATMVGMDFFPPVSFMCRVFSNNSSLGLFEKEEIVAIKEQAHLPMSLSLKFSE